MTSYLNDRSVLFLSIDSAPTLQHVQTDSSQLIDVGVVDLGEESDLGWRHGIVIWQEEFKLENASFKESVAASGNTVSETYPRTVIVKDHGC